MNAHHKIHTSETRLTDKQELCKAIDAVCADLQALKARMHNSSLRTMEMQVESFDCYEDYARDVLGFTNDLRVTAVTIAASLGNRELTKSDIEAIRDIDPINDIFSDCHDWRDEVMDELEAA